MLLQHGPYQSEPKYVTPDSTPLINLVLGLLTLGLLIVVIVVVIWTIVQLTRAAKRVLSRPGDYYIRYRHPRLTSSVEVALDRLLSERMKLVASGQAERPENGGDTSETDVIEARVIEVSSKPSRERFVVECVRLLASSGCMPPQAPTEVERILARLPEKAWIECSRSQPYVSYSDRDGNWTSVTVSWTEHLGPDLDTFRSDAVMEAAEHAAGADR